MRDEYAQANKLPGNTIQHVALNEFISRNYAHDSLGRYFFKMVLKEFLSPWMPHHGLPESFPVKMDLNY